MIFPDISGLVPHSGTMMLLDRVIQADHESLCAEITVDANTVFFDGNGVGAWIGVEYMAQAIAAHAGYLAGLRGDPVKIGFLLGARRYECSRASFPLGSILHVHVRRTLQGENGLGAFDCRIEVNNEVNNEATSSTAATATITVFQPENVNDFLHGISK
jgi:predicted hotdog family 3-hydroxylacyl-ACP dehydratase